MPRGLKRRGMIGSPERCDTKMMGGCIYYFKPKNRTGGRKSDRDFFYRMDCSYQAGYSDGLFVARHNFL